MNEPKKHRWFQFYLSTLLVAVFIGSLMIYINTLPSEHSRHFPEATQRLYLGGTQHLFRGWPYAAWSFHYQLDGAGWTEWSFLELGADILVGLGLVFWAAIVFEYIIQMPLTRRKA